MNMGHPRRAESTGRFRCSSAYACPQNHPPIRSVAPRRCLDMLIRRRPSRLFITGTFSEPIEEPREFEVVDGVHQLAPNEIDRRTEPERRTG